MCANRHPEEPVENFYNDDHLHLCGCLRLAPSGLSEDKCTVLVTAKEKCASGGLSLYQFELNLFLVTHFHPNTHLPVLADEEQISNKEHHSQTKGFLS